MKNNKGFTLIELLAVIVILGILMMMAIPAVTKYIENSRKDAFYQTGKSYIEAARTPLLNGDYVITSTAFTGLKQGETCDVPPANYYTAIPIAEIELEKGKGKSSFNRILTNGFVIAINKGSDTKDDIEYYFAAVDAGGNGIEEFTSEANLKRSSVKKGTAKVTTAISTVALTTNTPSQNNLTINRKTYTLYARCGSE